jgi:signal transduction histidine kinase
MNYNLITNIQGCFEALQQTVNVSMLYYSHIPTAVIALLLGFFVIIQSRNSLVARILFALSITFSLWAILDLVAWLSSDSRLIMLTWALLGMLDISFFILSLYFVYVFIDKKDVSFLIKLIWGLLILPIIIMTPTTLNLYGFEIMECSAQDNSFMNYIYYAEIIITLWIIVIAVSRYRKAEKNFKKQIVILSMGIILFLLSFFITGYLADLFSSFSIQGYGIEIYGLFGMTFFMGVLTFMIVKFKALNIKFLGAQALVATLIILIGSQFAFIQNPTNKILNGITLLLSLVFGWFLVKSVKEEVKRKEELQKLSDSLAVTNDRLRELDNAKSEFISIASHQLRTPLTAIKGYTSLLLEGSYGKVAAPVQDVLDKVYTINNRLVELVENLLNISRIEAGRIQYNFEMVWLEPLVKDIVDMFAMTAKNKNLKLTFKLPEQMLPKLTIDPNKIKEVVSNLIDNALKYTKEGGITVSVEAREGSARIIVADTGMGISRDDKAKLFEKFIRSKETASMFVSGSGLGLYIGKSFVQAHGGKIWAESEGMGKGSQFIVELPFLNPNLKIGISEQSSMLGRGK